MAYCDIDDVRGQIPQRRFDVQTTPTVDQVLRYCRNRSAELDAILRDRGYEAPVLEAVSPVGFGWLRSAATYGAAMDAESAGFPGQGDQGETPRLAFLRGQWERMVDQLRAGDVRLGDVPLAETPAGSSAFRFAGASTGVGPWFNRGQTFTGGDGPSTILPG